MPAATKTPPSIDDALPVPPDEQPDTVDTATVPTPEPRTPEPLVDLDDIAPDRPTVRFQAKLYDMRILDDFGIRVQQQLTRDGREFFRLWSSEEELSDTDGQRLEMLLARMFDQVLDAPARVKKLFTDGKKSQVVLGFVLAPLAQRTAQQNLETAQEPRDDPPTTGS